MSSTAVNLDRESRARAAKMYPSAGINAAAVAAAAAARHPVSAFVRQSNVMYVLRVEYDGSVITIVQQFRSYSSLLLL